MDGWLKMFAFSTILSGLMQVESIKNFLKTHKDQHFVLMFFNYEWRGTGLSLDANEIACGFFVARRLFEMREYF